MNKTEFTFKVSSKVLATIGTIDENGNIIKWAARSYKKISQCVITGLPSFDHEGGGLEHSFKVCGMNAE
jgi:hypothetical protein